MPYFLAGLGLVLLGAVAHAVITGALLLQIEVDRATRPGAFWSRCACYTAIGLYLLWLAWHDFA